MLLLLAAAGAETAQLAEGRQRTEQAVIRWPEKAASLLLYNRTLASNGWGTRHLEKSCLLSHTAMEQVPNIPGARLQVAQTRGERASRMTSPTQKDGVGLVH